MSGHWTKDGRFMSESECQNWFERLCVCGHRYGIHYPNESCHYEKNGKFCPCTEFRLEKEQS